MLARQPQAIMQLRYLQTLTQIAGDKSSTIVFPLPMELLDVLRRGTGRAVLVRRIMEMRGRAMSCGNQRRAQSAAIARRWRAFAATR